MAHSFLELDKAVGHVIGLISFLGFMDQVKSCSYEEKKNLGYKKIHIKISLLCSLLMHVLIVPEHEQNYLFYFSLF